MYDAANCGVILRAYGDKEEAIRRLFADRYRLNNGVQTVTVTNPLNGLSRAYEFRDFPRDDGPGFVRWE
jgi:hypothetical protein